MPTKTITVVLIFIVSFLEADCTKYFIKFTDKNNSPYSITNPAAYLSSKAIQRRQLQNIPISASDIPVNPFYIDSLRSIGATILNPSKWFNGVTIECDSNLYQSIRALGFVENGRQIRKLAAPKEKKLTKILEAPSIVVSPGMLRSQSFDYGSAFNQIHLMNGEYLHDEGFTGSGMTIAVLDAGFFRVDSLEIFDSLRSQNRILGTWDFVEGNHSVYEDNSHGMQVLSCITGNIPGQMVGTAPGASFWLLRTEDVSTEYLIEEYNWVSAAEFADSVGTDLITSSLGYSTFDDSTMDHSYSDMDGNTTPCSIGADIAASKGILVILSAGNNGNSSWHYISAPSDADSAMCIAAVDEFGIKAGFSSWGPSSDGDIKPNVAAKGQLATVANSGGGVGLANGTSFACPILAGSAACLWQAHPDKTNMEVFKAIEQSANYYLTPGDSLGYGIPNFIVADLLLGGTDLNLLTSDNLLGIYPNPYHDEISLKFFSAVSHSLDIEIYDALGRLVMNSFNEINRGAINNITLSGLSDARQGMYFVLVRTKEKSFLRKAIKY